MVIRREHQNEDGFTLVELLITMVIEALILGALGAALIGILNGTKSVNQSLSRSGDARIAANYIIADARNSSGPEVSLGTASCTDAHPPVSGTPTPIVEFDWTSTSSNGTTTAYVVDYVLVNNSLLRRTCKGGSTVSVNDSVVASSVATVTAVCSPTPNCTGDPDSISVTVREVADSSGTVYQYTLTGSFRKLGGSGAPVQSGPSQSVILFGSGSTCVSGATALSMSTSAHITVYGTAVINNTDSSCAAMNMTTSSSFVAGQTKVLAGGTCNDTTSAVCPTTTPFAPAITDPYETLAAPVAATLGLLPQSGCPGGTAVPGVYSSTLSITTSSTCQLQPGVYILNNGISVSTSARLTSAGGVLLYIANGSFSSSTSATVDLTAQSTNPWAGIAIWQAKTNTNTVSFSTSGAVTIDGIIYAPSATVNMSTSASNPTVKGIVAKNMIMTTSANLVIGTRLSINSPATLADATAGLAYPTTSFTASGGGGAYAWSATGLPPGLSISATTGDITGTPTTAGTYAIVVRLADAVGDTPDTASYSVTIFPAPAITSASPLPGGDLTVAYNRTVTGTGGSGALTWSATNLPTGLSMNATTGAITGTPTAAGTKLASVTVTDSKGATDTEDLSLTISAMPTVTTASPLAAGEKTAPYNATVAGSGGTAPYAFTSSTLPAGLSIASGTGIISGSPTATGTTSASILLTDAAGGTVSKSLSITVGAQPVISSVTLTNRTTPTVGVAGKMEVGDKITVVFGSTMKVSSFCSSWIGGDTSNPTLTGNNLLVNVADGTSTTNDSLTITNTSGTGCTTFNFGTINLGSNAYVTAAAKFGGSAGNTSIAWTASSKTLMITLGALQSGTVGTVSGTTTPIFTASGSITDSAGATLGNPSFTITPAAVRF